MCYHIHTYTFIEIWLDIDFNKKFEIIIIPSGNQIFEIRNKLVSLGIPILKIAQMYITLYRF